jgi:hypothetical protein
MRALKLLVSGALLLMLAFPAAGEDSTVEKNTFPSFKLQKVGGGDLNSETLAGKPFVANLWATW